MTEVLKHYGYGIVDKNGEPYTHQVWALRQSADANCRALVPPHGEDIRPFRVVELYYYGSGA